MITKNNRRLALCGILIGALLAFIWGNSLTPGDESSQLSGWVGQLIGKLFPIFSPDNPNGSYLLRKCAHFAEFCVLGGLLCWGSAMLMSLPLHVGLTAFGTGVAIAAIDETIQRFIPGRYGCIPDVLLDAAGVLTGILGGMVFLQLLNKYRKGAV